MTTKDALLKLKRIINNAPQGAIEDIAILMEIGAGHLLSQEGRPPPQVWPEELETYFARMRETAEFELSDAVALELDEDGDFSPCYSGPWEAVLASLLVDEDWATIHITANELVRDAHDLLERHAATLWSGFWQIERIANRLSTFEV